MHCSLGPLPAARMTRAVEIDVEGGVNMRIRAATRRTALTSAALVALTVAPVGAQTPPAASTSPPAVTPAPGRAAGMLEGSIHKVDAGAGTLRVSSGPLGIFGKTLEVNGDTQIQIEGRQASLADLQEGAKIKASYETREGKNVATRIEVEPPH